MDTVTLGIAWAKYLGPTTHRGARIRVTANDRTITRHRDYSVDPDQQALAMVREILGLGPEAQFTTAPAKGGETLYTLAHNA